MIKSKYIAKILAKLRIPSFDKCELDKTCNVNYESALSKVKMGRYSICWCKNDNNRCANWSVLLNRK